ncbi:MAG: hypothetical protein ACJAT6_000316 [Akkermansiaceae bacterium]|jgi:hypothetical protein|nr:hypothetical protein [Akkermansiaceae bacterium]|tara:strand:- start:4508 stop:4708 length:201 start_codon:yes stop_codon:yes gene_type:complete
MKRAVFTVLALAFVSVLTSCEAPNNHVGGGGAFDESELGRKLDANSHLDDPEIPGGRTYEQWRDDN